MEFYQYINKIDKSKRHFVATVIDGDRVGAKAIFQGRELIYDTGYHDFWGRMAGQWNEEISIIGIEESRIYIEKLQEDCKVVICGAGHISIPLIQISKMLGFHVTTIDDRPLYADNARKAGADFVICDSFQKALSTIQGDANTFFIIVTRGHRHDQVCLENILQKENRYIGMIGSRMRVRTVKDALMERGTDKIKLDRIYSPIGLNIKAETPAEIAVAIMGEIILQKNMDQGGPGYSKQILNSIAGEENKNMPKALVTIVARKGPAPRGIGTKMLVLKDGTIIDTIGGGCVESEARQKAIQCMEEKKPSLITVDMTGNAEEEGMVCGGIISLFIEPIL